MLSISQGDFLQGLKVIFWTDSSFVFSANRFEAGRKPWKCTIGHANVYSVFAQTVAASPGDS